MAAAAFTFAEERPAVPAPVAKELPDCVVVIGEVRTQQAIRYGPGLTLSGAVSTAGGIGDFGAAWVYVIRNGVVKHKTSGQRMRKEPKTEDIELLPWDTVCVGNNPVR